MTVTTTRAGLLGVMLSASLLALHVNAATLSPEGIRSIAVGGVTSPHSSPPGVDGGVQAHELAPAVGRDASGPSSQSASRQSAVNRHMSRYSGDQGDNADDNAMAKAKSNPQLTMATSNPQLLVHFQGLDHRDQRLANGGNQFSLEPPDQGLCVGNGKIVEVVNDVIRVYDTAGNFVTGVMALTSFFGYPPEINRSTGAFGPFVTDPSCLFDAATQRFFLIILTLDVDSASGNFLGSNHLDLAVSQTADPAGAWTIYTIPVQDDGTQGTPNHHCTDGAGHAGFPCLGDYPHIGADATGFYITTNEYEFVGNAFVGAQLYALSKRQLAAGGAVTVTQFNTAHAAPGGKPGFTIWPAQGSGNQHVEDTWGSEYALSSTAADEAQCVSLTEVCSGTKSSNNILLWTLTGTGSLDRAHPSLALSNQAINVRRYAVPPPSNQKAGDFPLGQCLNDTACSTNFVLGAPDPFAPEVESTLDSNDTRMQQVWYAHGTLWSAVDTVVKVKGNPQAGIEYFAVDARSGELELQGTLALAGNNLIYPAIAMTNSGRGVMAFTVVGNDHFPSAGYAGVDAERGAGAVQIASEGAGPQDGFSGYKGEGNPPGSTRPRWGDFGAAVVDGNTIWIASEYIAQTCTLAQYETTPVGSCGGTRTLLANWSTHISDIQP
jgi:hypothetical protein